MFGHLKARSSTLLWLAVLAFSLANVVVLIIGFSASAGSVTGSGNREALTGAPGPTARTLSLAANPKTLSSPGKTKLTATLSLCSTGEPVEFQVRKNGEFETFKSVATDYY